MSEALCIDGCGEPGTCPDGRCRDCDLDNVYDTWPRCASCGVLLFNETAKRLGIEAQHETRCASDRPAQSMKLQ